MSDGFVEYPYGTVLQMTDKGVDRVSATMSPAFAEVQRRRRYMVVTPDGWCVAIVIEYDDGDRLHTLAGSYWEPVDG